MCEKLVLRGSMPDQVTRQRATAIAKAYAGDGLTDLTSITGRQMVAVDVRFAAVSAGTLKAPGFNFSKLGGDIQGALAAPDSLGGVSLPNTGVPAPFDLDRKSTRLNTRPLCATRMPSSAWKKKKTLQ